MALHDRIDYLRKEHEGLVHLSDRIEKMLESASKNDVAEHLKSLTGLRTLEHGLAGIVEHCNAENRIVESTYHHYLQQGDRTRIDTEHEQIIRAATNFREELKFATTDRTMAIILPGMDVVNRLRAHIAYERELLDRIVQLTNKQKKTTTKKEPSKATLGTRRKHARKGKMPMKATHVVPYTLEPHPEL